MTLQVLDVYKAFGPVRAVQGVSFTVPAGRVCGLLGSNGAGKTTTMRMIMRIFLPARGEIQWKGRPVTDAIRSTFGYLPEERGLYPKMQVREQLIYLTQLKGLSHAEAARQVDRWIERLELGEYALRRVEQLSKGNQQKVQFAAAAASRPELCILDEPFTGLDPMNTLVMEQAFRTLAREGTTILFSSHNMDQVEALCDDVVLLHRSRVVLAGTLREVKRAARRQTVRLRVDSGVLTPGEGDERTLMAEARAQGSVLLILDGTYPDAVHARLLYNSMGDLSDSYLVTDPLVQLVRAARLEQRGLPQELAQEVLQPLTLETLQLRSAEEGASDQFLGTLFLALGAIMSVYMISMMNSQFVFQGVLEEKVSRVVEVMAAAVRPSEMMLGKILGLGLLGILQYIGMMAAWLAGSALTMRAIGASMAGLTPGVALLIAAFVVLSYAMNASVLAALGATVSRMEDSQTMVSPVLILMMLPMFLLTPVMNDPNGTLATALSFVPLWTPIVMLMRVMMADVPAVQVAVSLALLAATTALLWWASGRIYRAALLSFGARPTLKQLWQYLRAG